MTNISLIKQAMERLGLSKAELARRSGIDPGLIGRYLDGTVEIGLKNAPKLAAALELTVSDVLFGRKDNASPPPAEG